MDAFWIIFPLLLSSSLNAEKIPQDIDDIRGVEIAFHPDCQTLPRGLINVTTNAAQGCDW